jgi:hypothetical protein
MVNGKELVFRRPGEESDGESDEDPGPQPGRAITSQELAPTVPIVEAPTIVIHEDY